MAKTVKVTINKKGDVTVDLDGFHGEGCKAIVEALTAAAGGEVTSMEAKPEFYEPAEREKEVS